MRKANVRRYGAVCMALVAMLVLATDVHAASEFAAPGFREAYYAGEAITPNFWGPISTATDAYTQTYNGRDRTVQYFDKARMEYQNGRVSFGLLATEMVTGRLQIGDNDFVNAPLSNNPVAGDENGEGVRYIDLYNAGSTVRAGTNRRTGEELGWFFANGRFVSDRSGLVNARIVNLTDYDSVTRHNVIQVFRLYREAVGFTTIGYAITEPFLSYFTVGGKQTPIIVQVFERRVLTFTPENPPAYQVEMGNIGRHYFRWRRDVTS